MDDITEILKSLHKILFFNKNVSKIENEAKEQKGAFFSMLLVTFDAILLGYLITGKGAIRDIEGTIRAGERTIRASKDF